jgi:hypothetical protein
MTTVHGLPACSCLAAWIPVFETAIGRTPRWFQLIGDAPASAGFHRGGGSADSEPLSEDELRIARNMGAAAWNRWWTDPDGDPNYHAHLRLNGCPHNTIGQPQVADLNAGRDGTGPLYDNAGVPDNGPRDGVLWPLRNWREGIAWAEALQEEDMAKYREWDQADKDALVGDIAKAVSEAVWSYKIDVGTKAKRAAGVVVATIHNRKG